MIIGPDLLYRTQSALFVGGIGIGIDKYNTDRLDAETKQMQRRLPDLFRIDHSVDGAICQRAFGHLNPAIARNNWVVFPPIAPRFAACHAGAFPRYRETRPL